MDYINCVKIAAKYLLQEYGVTTTLDIKNYLIENFPVDNLGDTIIWKQRFVSATMMMLQEQGNIKDLTFSDNGTYRTYFIEPEVEYVSRKKLIKELKDHKGRFITVNWVAKDKKERNKNVKIQTPFQDDFGYIRVKTSKGKFNLIDPKTLLGVKKSGRVIQHKSLGW